MAAERVARDAWSPLIGAEQALQHERLLVLDARDATAYAAGHVPGATWLPIKAWEQLARTPEGDLQDTAGWAEQIGALGIDGLRPVAVYDDGRATEAARAWFILQWHGVDAHVVDGGWPALQRVAGFRAEPGEPGSGRPQATTYLHPEGYRPRAGLITRDALREALGGPLQVLDARTAAEHAGDDLRANARGGHLPDARLLSHAQLLQADGTLKPADELRALFAQAGVDANRPVATHCDAGGRAALAALAALVAGQRDVSAYYLSFSDWARDEACPVVRPRA